MKTQTLKLVYFAYVHSIVLYEIILGGKIQWAAKNYFASKRESSE
jgi:hypothetical protein